MRFNQPIALIAAAFLLTKTVNAQSFTPPENCVAFYRFAPEQFESANAVASFLPLAIQLGAGTGLINESFRPLFDGLAAAAIAGAVPHSITIHNFDGQFDPEAKNNFRITELQAVLSLETPANHRTYLQSLAQILSHYQTAENNPRQKLQSIIQLKNGQTVGRFLFENGTTWQALEWASTAEAFYVGIGIDSIKTHLAQIAGPATARPFAEHFKFPDATPAANHFLALFVNLEKLHTTLPEVLAQGRPRRMLTTWKLDNARNYFLHGRIRGKYLHFEITYERRSDPARIVHHRPLTLNHWPGSLELPEPPGDFLIVIPIQFEAAFNRSSNAYRATLSPPKLAAFNDQMKKYQHQNRAALQTLWDGFKPFIIISNYPKPPVPIPGAATLYLEMVSKNPSSPIMQNCLEAILETFLKSPTPEKLGQAAIRYDKKERLYYLQLEKTGNLRIPTWAWIANRYLIAGWGPPVIETNRNWLEAQER